MQDKWNQGHLAAKLLTAATERRDGYTGQGLISLISDILKADWGGQAHLACLGSVCLIKLNRSTGDSSPVIATRKPNIRPNELSELMNPPLDIKSSLQKDLPVPAELSILAWSTMCTKRCSPDSGFLGKHTFF